VTAPFEIEEAEALPIDRSHLVRVACVRRCGQQTLADPSQVANALCGPCRLAEASVAATILRLPAVAPPPMAQGGYAVSLAPRAAERAENGCPICATARVEATCSYAGHEKAVSGAVVCRGEYCGHALPAPVHALDADAMAAGWDTVVRHSVLGGKHVWSVRFRRSGAWAGYAVRRGDAWTSVCITGETLPPFLALGVTDLRQWLADPAACGEAWVEAARQRAAAGALHKKIIRCPGAPRCVAQGPARAPDAAVIGPEHTHRADGSIVKKVSRKQAVQGM